MKFIRKNAVYSKKIDHQVIILEKDKKHIRQLNETASFLWEQVTKPKTIDQLTKSITNKFKIDKNQAKQDVNSWVKTYLNDEFLKEAKH